jgi:bile acid:Na+ symporter, BASS family
MESSILTSVFLPGALIFIMFGMGLSLTIEDFKRIARYPGPVLTGLFNQLILLPIMGFLVVKMFGLKGDMAIGIMIIAACPGGVTSNLISYLARGSVALSISLTAISSLITIISIPLVLNFSLTYFGREAGMVALPVGKTMAQVFGVTLLPVSVGMLVLRRKPHFALKMDKPTRIFSLVLFIIIILAAILKERANIVEYFLLSGPPALTLNIVTISLGFGLAAVFRFNLCQKFTLAIESGIQNGTLGILLALSILHNSTMSIPPAIYSLIMFGTGFIMIFMGTKLLPKRKIDPDLIAGKRRP